MPDGTEETIKRFEKELNEMSKESEEDKARRLEELGRMAEALKQPNPNMPQPEKPPRQDIPTNILRQRIEGLKRALYKIPMEDGKHYWEKVENKKNEIRNQAIDDVLDVHDEFLQETDQPDTEGPWLRYENNRWIATQIYTNPNGDLFYSSGKTDHYDLNRFKWVRAVAPEAKPSEEKSLEELAQTEKRIVDTLNSAITQLVNYNKEINFFGDNISRLMAERDSLMEDIDYIMSK